MSTDPILTNLLSQAEAALAQAEKAEASALQNFTRAQEARTRASVAYAFAEADVKAARRTLDDVGRVVEGLRRTLGLPLSPCSEVSNDR